MAIEIADALGEKYETVSYNLPSLGHGKAEYRSNTGNTQAVISYDHVSFDAHILISTPKFDEQKKEYHGQQLKTKKNKFSNTF